MYAGEFDQVTPLIGQFLYAGLATTPGFWTSPSLTPPPVPTQFWDGATTAGDGIVHGGSGTWNNSATNWAMSNGLSNTSWQAGFAVFAGAAGTVAVGDAISYQGLQFSTTGYTLTATGGGTLIPTGIAPVTVDAGLTATISASITGSGGLQTTGPGTLILSGANGYSGGTTISAGTLQVSGSGTLGATTGTLGVSGGILDLGATTQTTGALTLTGGTIQNGTLTSASFGVQTGTVSAILAGGGALTKTGGGTVTLAGVNTYSGGTTIAAGTLVLGDGGTTGSITGSIIDNGTLAINHSDTFTLGAGVSGSGGFAQIGSGTTVVAATETYTGATSVNAGVLEVDGSIATSSLTNVNNGGVLIGVGTVGNTQINSGGTFAPGAAGVPGTSMTVQGNLAFQSGALYLVQINPATSTLANVVTGTATLAGNVLAVFAPGKYMMHDYTILQSAGLNGSFAGLGTVNLPTDFVASLKYNADDVMLNITANLPLAGLNGNQGNVANALNNYFNSGGALTPNFLTLFGLTDGNLANALSRLSGEASVDAAPTAFKSMNQFLSMMLDPFVDGRSGPPGGSALGFAPDQPASFPPDIALAYDSVLKAPPKVAAFDGRWTAWGASYGGAANTNGNPVAGSTNFTAQTFGFAAGMDRHFTPDFVAGFALAGGGTHWGLAQDLGSGRSDAVQAGVYATKYFGPAYVAANVAFANNWFTTNRTAFGGDQLSASFNGQSYGGRVEAGYRYTLPAMWTIAPYGALQVQNFHTPRYSETDLTAGGFGLTYNAMSAYDTRSELGARFDEPIALYGTPVQLRARLAWAHDWVDNPALQAVFQALPGSNFIVNGAAVPKNSALTTASAELHLTRAMSLLAKFDGEFAPRSQTYAGSGTLRYAW
jgi:outer membrane autotransporter protein